MSDTTLPPTSFTTGLAPLQDVGTLAYNGVTFSSLFGTDVRGEPDQDNAGRTVKWFKVTIEAAGIVTLPPNATTTDSVMNALRTLLNQDGGKLIYKGRGFGQLNVNLNVGGQSIGNFRDLNWGPKPETLHFQPLGAGRSAMVHWQVTTWISQLPPGGANVLQFNEEINITYDEDFYSGISIRGTLEIGMTRATVSTRTLSQTVDDYRERWLGIIGRSIDLRRFRVTRRHFDVSRDKRVMEWEFAAEELPPAVMPFGSPTAHGSFRFQPQEKGVGFIKWLCSLRCTYTIDKRYPRRTAWFHFATLLWYRMLYSRVFGLPNINNPNPAQQAAARALANEADPLLLRTLPVPFLTPTQATNQMSTVLTTLRAMGPRLMNTNALLIGISGDEGLYLDAKTVTFEAQWKLFTPLSNILMASGFWRYIGMRMQSNFNDYIDTNNAWAVSLRDVAGWKSWLSNHLDPRGDAIVDFGSDGPPGASGPFVPLR